MKNRYKVMIASGILFFGGATGYAATTIFGDLDGIRANFDTVLNIANQSKNEAAELQAEVDRNTKDKAQLEGEIERLTADITRLNQEHSAAITDLSLRKNLEKDQAVAAKQAEITAKQEEIARKQVEVDGKQAEIDSLTNQLSTSQSQLANAENQVRDLKTYTDQKVAEISE